MDKDLDFIETERNYWGKIYTEIMFALNEVSPFIEEKKLKQRKYYSKSDALKEYIKLLDSAETDCKKNLYFLYLNLTLLFHCCKIIKKKIERISLNWKNVINVHA